MTTSSTPDPVTEKYMTVVDGQEVPTLAGIALLTGVTLDDARAEFARQGLPVDDATSSAAFRLPKDWFRRCKESVARVHTQYDAEVLIDVIAILAEEADANRRGAESVIALGAALKCPDCDASPQIQQVFGGPVVAVVAHHATCPWLKAASLGGGVVVVSHRVFGKSTTTTTPDQPDPSR